MQRTKTTLAAAACGLAVYTLLRAAHSRRTLAGKRAGIDDSIEYPEIRAHVYHASPEQSFKAARNAIMSLPNLHILSVEESDFRLTVEAQTPGAEDACGIVLQALPLGPRHARVVIRSRASAERPTENTSLIRAIQAAMDQKLVGG